MMFGQYAANKHDEQRTAEHRRKDNPADHHRAQTVTSSAVFADCPVRDGLMSVGRSGFGIDVRQRQVPALSHGLEPTYAKARVPTSYAGIGSGHHGPFIAADLPISWHAAGEALNPPNGQSAKAWRSGRIMSRSSIRPTMPEVDTFWRRA